MTRQDVLDRWAKFWGSIKTIAVSIAALIGMGATVYLSIQGALEAKYATRVFVREHVDGRVAPLEQAANDLKADTRAMACSLLQFRLSTLDTLILSTRSEMLRASQKPLAERSDGERNWMARLEDDLRRHEGERARMARRIERLTGCGT